MKGNTEYSSKSLQFCAQCDKAVSRTEPRDVLGSIHTHLTCKYSTSEKTIVVAVINKR